MATSHDAEASCSSFLPDKPLLSYSSNTWSAKSKDHRLKPRSSPRPRSNTASRRKKPPLLKHSSVDYQEGILVDCDDVNHKDFLQDDRSQSNFHLSILDLQTLRRDSQVKGKDLLHVEQIRPPQQDVFKLHKPGFHISTERVWFPRASSATPNHAQQQDSEESTTLADEEVEVKLPCRSVSINVVGMPSDNDEVNARPSPNSNDFQDSIQPLLLTSTGPSILSNPLRQPNLTSLPMNGGNYFRPVPLPSAAGKDHSNSRVGDSSSETKRLLVTNGITQTGKRLGDEVEKLSPCCRYKRPAVVSLISVGLIMSITFLVLYLNYSETVHRRMTKKQGYILDHWGKGSPSAAETAVLDLEVEKLKEQDRETKKEAEKKMIQKRKEQVDDLLVIDGRPLNSVTTAATSLDATSIFRRATEPSRMDSRVD